MSSCTACPTSGSKFVSEAKSKSAGPAFRFQYKGLYPTLEEASRLSQSLRTNWEHLVDEVDCSVCGGSRLRDDASAVRLLGRTIHQLCRLPLGNLVDMSVPGNWMPGSERLPANSCAKCKTGCGFWSTSVWNICPFRGPLPHFQAAKPSAFAWPARSAADLCGVLYVLDEPTIGLHPRDNRRLIGALEKLRDLGNTLLLVEHDREVLAGADQLLDFGPTAGDGGGEIVARGTPAQISRQKTSVTGPYLSGKKAIAVRWRPLSA